MSSPLTHAMVSRFRNSFDSSPITDFNLEYALNGIRNGSYESAVNRVRHILAREGKRAYNRAKARLEAFTFGGTFHPLRAKANLQQHSCIVHGDLDHLDPRSLLDVKHALCGDPYVAYAFISPSALGLKLGVHVHQVADDGSYKYVWQVVSTEYAARYGVAWDVSGTDVSRLCFISHDPKLYWNPSAAVFQVPPPSPVQPARGATPSPTCPKASTGYEPRDYAEGAVRIAVQMVQTAQPGTRHYTRLRAARLLGGYVAGALLTEEQAYGALAQALVGHTEDLERALKTVEDGLKYGQAHPITVDALEAEREEWVQQHRNAHPRQQWTPPDNPWDGTNSLLLRPYIGYRGLRSRTRGKGATSGHSR